MKKLNTSAEDIQRLRSHVEWLRGDHALCNPWIADVIDALIYECEHAEAKRREAYVEGTDSGYKAGLSAAAVASVSAWHHPKAECDDQHIANVILSLKGKNT